MAKPEFDSAKYWEAEAKRYCQNAEYWRTENFRVRGLLQRIKEMVRWMPELNLVNYSHAEVRELNTKVCELDAFLQASQGAESADIGKLDMADKKADV